MSSRSRGATPSWRSGASAKSSSASKSARKLPRIGSISSTGTGSLAFGSTRVVFSKNPHRHGRAHAEGRDGLAERVLAVDLQRAPRQDEAGLREAFHLEARAQ